MQVAPGRIEADVELRRYEALLRMADSIARHRSVEALFREITARLRVVTSFEFIVFNLHDPATNQMCVYYSEGVPLSSEAARVGVDSSPSGWVWQHQKPLMLSGRVTATAGCRDPILLLRSPDLFAPPVGSFRSGKLSQQTLRGT